MVALLTATLQGARQRPAIAAAADLSFVLPVIADLFTRDTGSQVELVFGASGALARQIREGAPFELFLSADEVFVSMLYEAGLTRDTGIVYGIGQLVLFAPEHSPLVPADGIEGVRQLLADGRLTKFAIANPEHAPYGRAAEAVLKTHHLWDALRPHLVRGENASQAARFAAAGDAAGGLIAYSFAMAPAFAARGTFSLINPVDHPPLRQRMVRLRRSGPVADAFYDYLQQGTARAILRKHGFSVPQ